MRFTMNRDALLYAAQVAARTVSGAETATMACAMVEASDGSVSFSATDGDQSVRHSDMAMVDEPGSVLVSASALARMVKSMRDGAIEFESHGGSCSITGGGSSFHVPALDASEWMGMPSDCDGPSCEVGQRELLDAAKTAAAFCADRKESREAMKCIHVIYADGKMTMDATDSYRIVSCSVDASGEEPFDVMAPSEFMVKAAESVSGKAVVTSDGNRVMVSCESTSVSTRAVASKPYDIARMFPKKPNYSMKLDAVELSRALGMASQVGNGDADVEINAGGGKMAVSVSDGDAGGFDGSVACEGEHSGTFSIRLLKSCADAMDVATVDVCGDSEMAPMAFIGGSVKAAVMPKRGRRA